MCSFPQIAPARPAEVSAGHAVAGSVVVSVANLGQQLPPVIGDGEDRGVGACNKTYDVVGDQAIDI
jgi:hypothetical protein